MLQAASLSADSEELSQAGFDGQSTLQGEGGLEAGGGGFVAPEQAQWRPPKAEAGSGGGASEVQTRFAPVVELPRHATVAQDGKKSRERPPSRLGGMMGFVVFGLGFYAMGQALFYGVIPWLGILGLVAGMFLINRASPKTPRR